MYALYAEDTSSKATKYIRNLRSTRFSRAMREAKAEPRMHGCRYFIAKLADDTRSYLDAPARIGSPTHQAHVRRQAQAQVRPPKTTLWSEPNDQGETLGELYVDLIRRELERRHNA